MIQVQVQVKVEPLSYEFWAANFDEDGFLAKPRMWTPQLAQIIADLDGIGPLGDAHWNIIDYLREHYHRCGSLPVMSHVCRKQHLDPTAVRRLFGSCREVWRVAGLPNPGEEAKTYMA